ncbi:MULTISPECIES: hypothetical protein [unclassified Mesorhizobium]|jgi:hypothetical protein|uniref:hypothetical protein n=2 Tax=Mesorhizobium TaxID=68287 RepID=UPI0003CF94ED|nr:MULTISPECIES: hypothetical protein [unclassified Mesorhizobium]ESW91543.1 hypothetical protein X773_00620 [Mesorhizobium sp. LSJC285A00]ESX14335.1 hypothetical protein X768_02260 [Mesorhizobium sp. LSJC265A00]ESZ76598.1 hypothetical protein X726_05775 [Mesorhizobium sp. L103C105A0]
MYRKVFAASVLTIGLATSAMAQSSDGTYSNHHSWWPFGNEQSSTVDQSTTGSINADGSQGYGGATGPCASDPSGPYGNVRPNVNDQYCGK